MESESKQSKKLLLMGRKAAGKTSMHSIIFANYPARETMGIGFTVNINECTFRFMGNLTLNLWDCGGQDKIMKHYLYEEQETVFSNVQILIYVFDITSDNVEKDLQDYRKCIENLNKFSPESHVFVFIHKMDQIPQEEKASVIENKQKEFRANTIGMNISKIFATSIWDETLYKAWSEIVQFLIPNLQNINKNLEKFCEICDCDEIVLFEKTTFLIIAHHELKKHKDKLRFERLSNIVKQFKLSCSKMQALIKQIKVKNQFFTAYIQEFTNNTYIMVVVSKPKIQGGAIQVNIECARNIFSKSQGGELEDLLTFENTRKKI